MAKIPIILEPGRADGKLIKSNSIYDDNQEKFLSDKLEEIDNNHNTLNNVVNSLADEEDITRNTDGKLQFKNKESGDGMGYIILRKNKSFSEQVTKENTIYEIRYEFDLENNEIEIPNNCILKFEGGLLINGTLIGNNTSIETINRKIFENIIISGIWICENIYSNWFDFNAEEHFDNKQNIKNINALIHSNILNKIYFSENIWTSISENENLLELKSNTYIYFGGYIKLLTSSVKKGSILYAIKSDNIIINGANLIGDIQTHIDDGGEWLHGIKIGGCKNVSILNCSISYFWGDGIDLIDATQNNQFIINNYNIYINNCICNYNRRQGISLESGYNVIIENSEFGYTGTIQYTPPAHGIDIEPWNEDSCHINNVIISNCWIHDSKWISLGIFLHKQTTYKDEIKNIFIKNCITDTILLYYAVDTYFINTKYKTIQEHDNSENQYFIDGTFLNHYGEYDQVPKQVPNSFLYKDITNNYIKVFFNNKWDFIFGNKNNFELNENNILEIDNIQIPSTYPERIDNLILTDIILLPNVRYVFEFTRSISKEINIKILDEENTVLKTITITEGNTTNSDIFIPTNVLKVHFTTTCYDDGGGTIKTVISK